jgi:hypothetical protein
MRKDPFTEKITAFLDSQAISDYAFEPRSKHRALIVRHGGRTTTVIVPSTGSDTVRGPANAVAHIRRTLDLGHPPEKRANPTSPRPGRRNPKRAELSFVARPEPIERKDRFYEPLAVLLRDLQAATAKSVVSEDQASTVTAPDPVRIAPATRPPFFSYGASAHSEQSRPFTYPASQPDEQPLADPMNTPTAARTRLRAPQLGLRRTRRWGIK